MAVKRKHILIVFIFVLVLIGIVIFASFLLPFSNKDNSLSGNVIKLNDISNIKLEGKNISNKITGEVISKRTYNSQTYANADNTYTAVIGGGTIFFYDGEEYVELDKISSPLIEKKIITLNEIPKSNLIDFGAYQLHKGVDISISQNGELLISDANKKLLQVLPRPFSADANNNTIFNEYKMEIKKLDKNELNDATAIEQGFDRQLQLAVNVDKNWLKSASYPVEVDPTTVVLTNETGVYDGYIAHEGSNYQRYTTILDVGNDRWGTSKYGYHRAFIEFDTSSISESAIVTNVILNFTVENAFSNAHTINITRFNNSMINNLINYPNTDAGNELLGKDIFNGTGSPPYVLQNISLQIQGNKTFDLGTNADSDLQAQLGSNYFGVGLVRSNDENDDVDLATITNAVVGGVSTSPKLIVTYTANCPTFLEGDQYCNTTCAYVNQEILVPGDLYVQDQCTLTLGGTTTLYFETTGHYIYVYTGGVIYVNDTAQLSSPI